MLILAKTEWYPLEVAHSQSERMLQCAQCTCQYNFLAGDFLTVAHIICPPCRHHLNEHLLEVTLKHLEWPETYVVEANEPRGL